MKELTLRMPMFGFIVSTRAAMAFGVGLLVAPRIPEPRRKAIGMALVALGAITTVPAIRTVAGQLRAHGV
jgi:hypothetical protein